MPCIRLLNMSLKKNINTEKLPRHIAIIMDGNGRWAKKQGKFRVFGHRNGVKTVKKIVEAAGEIGLEFITLYAFSKENWNRPYSEIDALMQLLVNAVNNELTKLNEQNVKLLTIGDISKLPVPVEEKLNYAKKLTENNTGLKLILALNYGGRSEIIKATKKISEQIKNNKINIDDINNDLFNKYLYTAEIPDPDLLIRTSGEYRISNFLLWQIAYSELYFTNKFWPDFDKEDFYKAIIDYQNRERRFGKTSEQIKK